MWVVPVIACAVLQWMLLQTPLLATALPDGDDPLRLTYEGPSWIQPLIENDTLALSIDANEPADGHIRAEGPQTDLALHVTLSPDLNPLQRVVIEKQLHTVRAELAKVVGSWYSIEADPSWDIRSDEGRQTMDLSGGLQGFTVSLGPLIWLPLIALHFNNMVMPAVDMTDEQTRGTDETTRLSPCSPAHILTGKMLAVCGLGLIATSGQCFAMLLAVGHSMMLMVQSIPDALLASDQLRVLWPEPPPMWSLCLVVLFWVPTTLAHAAVLTWGAHRVPSRTAKELATLIIASVLLCGSLACAAILPKAAFWIPLINGPTVLSACFERPYSSIAVVTAAALNVTVAGLFLGWNPSQTLGYNPT